MTTGIRRTPWRCIVVSAESRLSDSRTVMTGIVMAITRQGAQLSAQATGQPSVEIYASSVAEFFYRVVNAQISFQVGTDGSATSLTLHQGGRDLPAKKLPD